LCVECETLQGKTCTLAAVTVSINWVQPSPRLKQGSSPKAIYVSAAVCGYRAHHGWVMMVLEGMLAAML